MTKNSTGPVGGNDEARKNQETASSNCINVPSVQAILGAFLDENPGPEWHYFDRDYNPEAEEAAGDALMDARSGRVFKFEKIALASGRAADMAAIAGHTLLRVETRGVELYVLAQHLQPWEQLNLPVMELCLNGIDDFLDEMKGLLESDFILGRDGLYRAAIEKADMEDLRRKLADALKGARFLDCREYAGSWTLNVDNFDWDSICGYVRRLEVRK